MRINLFCSEQWDQSVVDYIKYHQKEFLDQGNLHEDWPARLDELNVRTNGQFIEIDQHFIAAANLKFM